ncbi:helix-turn-helix transcriptional regulator [Nonomuraea sp. SMC257]|uniref:Helix-turn-helix transcriptional regulator n=1 Tax=Nonomuraea montanisoli TaxID=2741721 RepID=A0A7Y6I8M0_9ACTN|nr:helix-turn-helix transcriptional regulator [Nonomuraea montanisoli]NUW33426.1 helix-turn-helix transcriptional regulator [Nonomuraea montanisoli]
MHSKLSDVVASRVRTYRERKGLTREELAARCSKLHLPLTAAAITNIETGRRNAETGARRRDVTVDELVVLAKALGVPPILLLYPVGETDLVEVLPGRKQGTWQAVKWFTGEEPLGTYFEDDGKWAVTSPDMDDWEKGAAPVDDYRWHDRRVKDWNEANDAARAARRAAEVAQDDDERKMHLRAALRAERDLSVAEELLRDHRLNMRRRNVTPPELNDVLAHVDGPVTRKEST